METRQIGYAIVAPAPTSKSAGISALYKLRSDLQKKGERSRIILMSPYAKIGNGEIVVYPDTETGNPLGAKKVVRYLLMFAGFFGTGTNFGKDEMLYYHSEDMVFEGRDPGNILTIPVTDENRFPRTLGPRYVTCYLARKYQEVFGMRPDNLPPLCVEITNQTNLPALFSVASKLITYDNSAINLEAALAGVEIEYRFNPSFEKPISLGPEFDWGNVRRSYQELKERYWDVQLPAFIRRTKERFGD